MRQAKAYRLNDSRVFADPCLVAGSFWDRLKGLMGKDRLAQGEGLLLEPCSSIHTFFMRFPIDVAYLRQEGANYKVLAIRRDFRPWRMDFPVFGAQAVLELATGAALELREGDLLCIS